MTRAEVAKLVTVIMAAFPQPDRSTQTSDVYERMLGDLDYPTANAAIERLLATSDRIPSIAAIRTACMDLKHGDQKAGGEAWGECLKAISRWGIYRNPGEDFQFQDPVVAKVVAALGWQNLCNSENSAADRARFIELYDKLAVTVRRDENAGQLPAAQRLKALKDSDQDSGELVRQLAAAKAVKP